MYLVTKQKNNHSYFRIQIIIDGVKLERADVTIQTWL